MNFLETKIPPPLVALGFGLTMWLVSQAELPIDLSMSLPEFLRTGLGLILIVAGLSLDVVGAVLLLRAKTTVNPIKPTATSTFVLAGAYRFSRNPMYLGGLLILLGWGLFLANVVAIILAVLFVPYINRFQIFPEERALTAKFGADYEAYKKQVRRWL